MYTGNVTHERLRASVIAVPPLARRQDLSLNLHANRRLLDYLTAGGIGTVLYGGNANLYHLSLADYESLIGELAATAAADCWMIPAVGPAFGTMLDQAALLQPHAFPTAMVLPPAPPCTPAGVAEGFRRFVEAWGRPAVLYVKQAGMIDVEDIRQLFAEGMISWVKYAVERDDPADDALLRQIVDVVDPRYVVSGMGEQPAALHMRQFGLAGFTSGCVCVAPSLSNRLLRAVQQGAYEEAERLREIFRPLEDLRNAIHPIRVLHDAVTAAGVADMGPLAPLLSNLDSAALERVTEFASALRVANDAEEARAP